MKTQRLSNQHHKYSAAQVHASYEEPRPHVGYYNSSLVRCLLCYLGEKSVVRDPSHLLPARIIYLFISVERTILRVRPKITPTLAGAHAQKLLGAAARRPGN